MNVSIRKEGLFKNAVFSAAFRKNALSFLQLAPAALAGFSECVSCSKTTLTLPLCSACAKRLRNYMPLDSFMRCKFCGKPLVSESAAAGERGFCMECRENQRQSSLSALYPLHTYRQWKKDLVFEWKMEGERRLSAFFASLLFKALSELSLKECPLVPVPPRPGKIKENGWDQVEDLSSILCARYGIRVENMLLRKSSQEQKKLNREERLGSAGAVYEIRPDLSCVPKEAVLLDDIVTTGATMEKCAWLLKKAGVQKVTGLSLFIVD